MPQESLTPRTKTEVDQEYTNACTILGHKVSLKSRLDREIKLLEARVSELQQETDFIVAEEIKTKATIQPLPSPEEGKLEIVP